MAVYQIKKKCIRYYGDDFWLVDQYLGVSSLESITNGDNSHVEGRL